MEMLHTAQEVVRLSNAAHFAEGILLFGLAGVLYAQGLGYLQKSWHRYIFPAIGLLASLTLAGFLFFDHWHELGKALRVITNDMQQKQHLYMGTLIGFGSISEFLAVKFNKKMLHLIFPVAIASIGILFLVHPQHGSSATALRALFIHRTVGSLLVLGAVAHAGSILHARSKKVLLIITALAFMISGALFISYREPLMTMNHSTTGSPAQSLASYSLNLMSGKSYLAGKPVMVHFAIKDQNSRVLKDFDTVHEKKLHMIVVRKDRSNFQHVHPTFDQASGMFMIEPFTFPADGEYRVFADFTASNSQKDENGVKLPATPFQDVLVGDVSKYVPSALGSDRLTSSVNGFDTNVFSMEGDSPSNGYEAGITHNLIISISKNGEPYKNLQTYLGALGHMVVLGPKLEYIHAHATSVDVNNQIGGVTFAVNFPDPGQYKLYLQTQADNQVNTTDYTLSVKPNSGRGSPTKSQTPPSMNHMGH